LSRHAPTAAPSNLRTRDADATIGALFSERLRPSGLQIEGASLEDALIALIEQASQQRSAVTAGT